MHLNKSPPFKKMCNCKKAPEKILKEDAPEKNMHLRRPAPEKVCTEKIVDLKNARPQKRCPSKAVPPKSAAPQKRCPSRMLHQKRCTSKSFSLSQAKLPSRDKKSESCHAQRSSESCFYINEKVGNSHFL